MDFKTEWSSWLLIVLMMVIAYVINPWTSGSALMLLAQVVGLPLAAIALACIPVLIFCYLIKVIPDIDYSIRLAFLYFVYLLVNYFL